MCVQGCVCKDVCANRNNNTNTNNKGSALKVSKKRERKKKEGSVKCKQKQRELPCHHIRPFSAALMTHFNYETCPVS